MSINTLHFGCTALVGTNKGGVLKPDEHGYYDMVLGALEYKNSTGDTYTLSSALELLKPGTPLRRRIERGLLRGECGHPKMQPGMTPEQYFARIHTIEETLISHHISDLYVDMHSVRDNHTGKPIVVFRGKVKPCGPYGPQLKASIDNPKENVAFSVRSITNNKRVGFHWRKDFTNLITFDYVFEPGLYPATKYGVPTLESYSETEIPLDTIENLYDTRCKSGISMESATLIGETLSSLSSQPRRSADW